MKITCVPQREHLIISANILLIRNSEVFIGEWIIREPLDTKKQIYALAFAVYGLSEFYMSSKIEEAKWLAIELYHTILRYSYDNENGGYIEALHGMERN